jgi:hypothetical protein
MIRIELWKAFHQKTLYIVLGIGILLALLDSLETYRIIQEMIPRILQNKSRKVYEGIGLFGLWMSIYGGNLGAYVFRIVWPVLAAVPFGWSYWKERKDGSYYQIAARSGRISYYKAKYLAVFISGGIVIAAPMLISLLTEAMFCPVYPPSPANSYYAVNAGTFLSKLFYLHPWIYCLTWVGVTFLQGGVTACLCFVLGDKPAFGVIVTLFPYALYMLIGTLTTTLLIPVSNVKLLLHPLFMVYACPGYLNPAWLIFLYILLFGIISLIAGYYQVVRKEL